MPKLVREKENVSSVPVADVDSNPERYVVRSRKAPWQTPPSCTEAALWLGGTALALLLELSAISTLPTPGLNKNVASHMGLFNQTTK